jgi:PHD/YefM family antitoxin component YafN of YafNO toxin-antitoxin module
MVATQHSQSLAEFNENPTETLNRLQQTGDPEVLTVDGEVKAVLLSPAIYEEMLAEVLLERDVATIRRSMKEIAEGKGKEANQLFGELRAKLLALKAAADNGTAGE